MNSAALIVSNTKKFDHGLTHVRHDILHWLNVPERVTFKLCMTVYKCLHGMGPVRYICRRCAGRARRRLVVVICVNRGQLVVPRYMTNDCWQKGILLRWSVYLEQSS